MKTGQCIPSSNVVSSLPFRSYAVYEQFGRLRQLGPIYTLDIFRTEVYVVHSEALLPAIHRSHNTVSFAPAVKTVAETMVSFKLTNWTCLTETMHGEVMRMGCL